MMPFFPVITALWASLGSTLRVLRLDLSNEACRLALSPSIVFPSLEELSIIFSGMDVGVKTASELSELFTPLVNNHHSTLRSLRLYTHRGATTNISPLLHGLCHLPLLNTFGISDHSIPVRLSDNPGLEHFLQLHVYQLRELSFQGSQCGPHTQYLVNSVQRRKGFLNIQIRELNELEIRMHHLTDVRRTATYLHYLTHSFTSLTLHGKTLCRGDVETLINVLTSPSVVRRLTMTVDVLSPRLLALLAEKMPDLENVCLTYQHICSEDSKLFKSSALQLRETVWLHMNLYSKWKLRYLNAQPSSYVSYSAEAIQGCEEALRSVLPGLLILRLG